MKITQKQERKEIHFPLAVSRICVWYYEDNLYTIYEVLRRLFTNLWRGFICFVLYTATENVKSDMGKKNYW
jgi:hypothetical protein